jgi:FdhD protein
MISTAFGRRDAGLTLIGRARGDRFVALSCPERIVYDQSLEFVAGESARHRRKPADDDG